MHVFPFLKQFLENLQRLSAILLVQFDVNIDFKMRELTETEQLKIGQGSNHQYTYMITFFPHVI